MVVSNKKMSETQAMFYPPSLMPAFMGAYPPTKLGLSLYEGGSIGYFQNYRNETLSKFSVSLFPTYLVKAHETSAILHLWLVNLCGTIPSVISKCLTVCYRFISLTNVYYNVIICNMNGDLLCSEREKLKSGM